jgi:hypothetical protein
VPADGPIVSFLLNLQGAHDLLMTAAAEFEARH